MVDAADGVRFEEAKIELQGILADEKINTVPVLVLGNKIDKQGAVPEVQVKEALEIGLRCTGKKGKPDNNVRPVELFMCSVRMKSGYQDGFKWLAQFLD
jgi:GTP-binding protein SAR1